MTNSRIAKKCFENELTELLTECICPWKAERSGEFAYPYVVQRVSTKARERAALTLDFNQREAQRLIRERDTMMKVVTKALKKAGLEVQDVDSKEIEALFEALKETTADRANYENKRGLLYRIAYGNFGEVGRGLVPADRDATVRRLLGKAPDVMAQIVKKNARALCQTA